MEFGQFVSALEAFKFSFLPETQEALEWGSAEICAKILPTAVDGGGWAGKGKPEVVCRLLNSSVSNYQAERPH